MSALVLNEPEISSSRQEINQQLEKIFRNHRFADAEILKRFLSFIVGETFEGRSNHLKEYTIAVKVLAKPVTFKPQENGIVRIHAGRLRRALDEYYEDEGCDDQLVIKLPRGKYVPAITDQLGNSNLTFIKAHPLKANFHQGKTDEITWAVLPFICSENQEPTSLFADDLCLHISTMLMHVNEISVIAYQALRNLTSTNSNFKDLGASFGFNHAITGSTQRIDNMLRVNLQIIECDSYRQVWSNSYLNDLSKNNFFEIQDELCRHIVQQVRDLCNPGPTHSSRSMQFCA